MKLLKVLVFIFALAPLVAFGQYSLFDISSASSSQDTVCAGIPIQFNDLSYCPWDVMNEWTWDFGDGSGTSTEQNPTYTFTAAGTYTVYLNANNILNCGNIGYSKDIVVLDPPLLTSNTTSPTCNGDCDGSAEVIIYGLSTIPYSVLWDNAETTGYISNLCPGFYNVTVSDNYGCVQTNQLPIYVPPVQAIAAFIDGEYQGCAGDQVSFSGSAIGGNPLSSSYQYSWSTDFGSSDFTEPSSQSTDYNLNTSNSGPIYLQVTDDFGCTGSTSDYVTYFSSEVSGTVYVDGNPCPNCPIEVYYFDPMLGSWIQNLDMPSETDNSGQYQLTLQPYTDHVIRINPDFVLYPNTCPTYYGDVHDFFNASVISSDCDVQFSSFDINVITMPPANGLCTITGTIWEITTGKMAEEDPIPLIDVVVERVPPGGSYIVGHDITVIDGTYTFEFMPETGSAEYVIHVDIPSVPMMNYHTVTVGPNDVLFANLDYCVIRDPNVGQVGTDTCHTTGIITSVRELANLPSISASPNPTNTGLLTVAFTGIDPNAPSQLVVVDVTGRTVHSTTRIGKQLNLDLSALANGVYNLTVTQADQTATTRFIVGR